MALFTENQRGLRKRGSFDVQIRLDGEWIKFGMLYKQMDVLVLMAARAGQKAFAEEYRDRVKQNIREGGKRFGYPQNFGKYLQRKKSEGGGAIALRWSDTELNSVEVMTNAPQTRFMVGIPTGIRRPDYYSGDANKLEVHEYANIIEHGYSSDKATVEPRPVFSDTFTKTMKGKEGIRKFIERSIITKFGTLAIKVTKRL